MTEQLPLFNPAELAPPTVPALAPRTPADTPPGAARLLKALVARGMGRDALPAAAALALQLEREISHETEEE